MPIGEQDIIVVEFVDGRMGKVGDPEYNFFAGDLLRFPDGTLHVIECDDVEPEPMN